MESENNLPTKGRWFISDWFFLYMYPTLLKARKVTDFRQLKLRLAPKDAARRNADLVWEQWQKQKASGDPSVLKAVLNVFGVRYAFIGIWKILWGVFTWLGAYYFLKQLIAFIQNRQDYSIGHMWAGLLLATSLLSSISIHQLYSECNRVAVQVRAAVSSLIYRKTLRLSRIQGGAGEVLNLLNTDLTRIVDGVCNFHFLWSAFLEAAAILAITFVEIGVSAWPALFFVVLLLPVQAYLGNMIFKLNREQTTVSTERVHIMSEILTAIKLIKFYAWEKPFRKKIEDIRVKEMDLIYRGLINKTVNFTIVFALPPVIALCCLSWYVKVQGSVLTAAISFAVLSVLNTLRYPFFMLPMAVRGTAGAWTAFKRLRVFMLLEEVEGMEIQQPPEGSDVVASIQDASFKWDGSDGKDATLTDINLSIKRGSKVAIIGDVGSGKSSLIAALLGEIRQTKGEKLAIYGTTSYASQEAWLLNTTLRENVLFGMKYDKKSYLETIRVCALQRDLTLLVAGDLTEIAERGANLSGGQRQRVNLARAVHHDCDILLLDDPLSAVDQHVGQHIFTECFQKHLKEKTVIVSMHQLQYLQHMDWVIMMKDGKIAEQGTYQQLLESSQEFGHLIESHVAGDEEVDDEEGPVINDAKFEIPEAPEQPSTLDDVIKHKPPSGGKKGSSQMELVVTDDFKTALGHEQLSLADLHQMSVRKNLTLNEKTISSMIERHQRSVIRGDGGSQNVKKAIQNNEMSILTMRDGDFADEAFALERGKLVKEDSSAAKAGMQDLLTYSRAAWGSTVFFSIVAFFFIVHCARIFGDYWLRLWVPRTGGFSDGVYIGVYAAGAVVFVIGVFVRGYVFSKQSAKKSKFLHDGIFQSVMRAPMSFFDATPLGRILSAFSKHQLHVDDQMADALLQALQYLPLGLGAMVISAVFVPYNWAPVIGLALIAGVVVYFTSPAENKTKSLEAVTKPPIYAHLTATIEGLFSVRAYHAEKRFDDLNLSKLDDNHAALLAQQMVKSQLALNLDLLSSFMVYTTALLSVTNRDSSPDFASVAGFALSNVLQMLVFLQWSVRMLGEVIGMMSSVGQLSYYANNVPPEAPYEIPDKKPRDTWPEKGVVKFDNVGLKYTEFGVKVLKNISFTLRESEKVGIVGRTGSGKSTLLISLLRIVETCEGKITMDGVDISTLGLEDLRTKVAVIPQEAVLFYGNVRGNLDPFNRATDEEVWKALDSVQLGKTIRAMPDKLESKVIENGQNFSLGQRQLFCIARAVLSRSKILVLDEATANVSPETDKLLQTTIRENFQDITVLTIAHRLNTIIDSDRVMVLDQGRILEFDDPVTLLEKPSGSFKDLVAQTGPATAKKLYQQALEGQKNRSHKGHVEESIQPAQGATTIQELAQMQSPKTTLPRQGSVNRKSYPKEDSEEKLDK